MTKKKIKPLLPSLREKKRYLAFEVISKDKITNFDAVSESIFNSTEQFIGKLGMSEAGLLSLKDKWNSNSQRGLLRVNHKNVDKLKAALTMIEKIEEKDVIVKSVGVSGILNKAVDKYLKIAS